MADRKQSFVTNDKVIKSAVSKINSKQNDQNQSTTQILPTPVKSGRPGRPSTKKPIVEGQKQEKVDQQLQSGQNQINSFGAFQQKKEDVNQNKLKSKMAEISKVKDQQTSNQIIKKVITEKQANQIIDQKQENIKKIIKEQKQTPERIDMPIKQLEQNSEEFSINNQQEIYDQIKNQNMNLDYKQIKVGLLKGDQLQNIIPSPDTLMNEGIGLSDLAYYNVLMKGGRVTRNTIKKEEDPPSLTRTKTLQPSKAFQNETKKPQQISKKIREQTEPPTPAVVETKKADQKVLRTVIRKQKEDELSQSNKKREEKQKRKKNQFQFTVPEQKLEIYIAHRLEASQNNFPHFQYATNRFVLYGNGLAQVSLVQPTIKTSVSAPNKVQSIIFKNYDYDKLQASVSIYEDCAPISVPYNMLKFVSDCYLCPVKHIQLESLSEDFLENLQVDSKQEQSIVIVQIVDYTCGQDINIKNDGDDRSGLIQSIHKLDQQSNNVFYVLGKEDYEERAVLSGPVIFKNQITSSEAIELAYFLDKTQKPSQEDDELVNQNQIERIELLKTKFDIQTDITLVNADDLISSPKAIKPQDQIVSNQFINLAYLNEEVQNFVKNKALQLQMCEIEQKKITQHVEVNEQNLVDCLFTLCLFDNSEGQRRKGILVQFKQIKDQFMLLFRNIQIKSVSEKFEWVSLTSNKTEKKYHIICELNRGYVSLNFLKQLDNTYGSGIKLRSKHIDFISHLANQIQVAVQLNLQDNLSQKSNVFGVQPSIVLKSAPNKFAICSSPIYTPKDKDFANQISHKFLVDGQECIVCANHEESENLLVCAECERSWHPDCLQESDCQKLIGQGEKLWRCQDCLRCVNCKSMIGNKKLMLVCHCCNTAYHFDCLDPNQKASAPSQLTDLAKKYLKDVKSQEKVPTLVNHKSFKSQDNVNDDLISQEFKCETCVKCLDCFSNQPGENPSDQWSNYYLFCNNCELKRKDGNYCKVCYEHILEQTSLTKETDKLQCTCCQSWIHSACDIFLSCKPLQQRFKECQLQNEVPEITYLSSLWSYRCPGCRQTQRKQKMINLVKQLESHDKNRYFSEEFWDSMQGEAKQQYLQKIKNPVSFATIHRRLNTSNKYTYDAENLKADIEQLLKNAMTFNQSQLVLKEIQKLNSISNKLIYPEIAKLQKATKATYWEDVHKAMIHSSPQFQKLFTKFILSQEERLNLKDLMKDQQTYRSEKLEQIKAIDTLQSVFLTSDENIIAQIFMEEEFLKKGQIKLQLALETEFYLKKDEQVIETKEEVKTEEEEIKKTKKRLRENSSEEPQIKMQKTTDFYEKQTENLQKYFEEEKVTPRVSNFNPNNTTNKERSRKKMMEYYQREDDEACYYTNPIRCSFDDPVLVFEEMCYLCGSFGNQTDFVTCVLCAESFHTFCLQLHSNDIENMYQASWKCLNCKSCECCGKATDEDLLMFCGVCDRPYHSFCLRPKIQHIPENWKCEHCFKCKQCGTNEYYNEKNINKGANLSNNDYQLSKNFSLCYECGQNENKKLCCSICFEKTNPEMNKSQLTLRCRDCGLYSHTACSRVTLQELYDLMDEYNEKRKKMNPNDDCPLKINNIEQVYKCLDCMIKGKSVNFIILESCLHYENIHFIIERQRFLSEICFEILSKYFPDQFKSKAPKFIQKFISQNQDFFRNDEILIKWYEVMQTEVQYPQTIKAISNCQDLKINKQEEIIDSKENKKIWEQLDKTHWKKFNPFEASKYNYQNLFVQEQKKKVQSEKYSYLKVLYDLDRNDEVPDALKTENSMTSYKTSFLPRKRSMYESIYKSNLNKFSQYATNIQDDRIDNIQKVLNYNQEGKGRSIYISGSEMEEILYPTINDKQKLADRLINGIDSDEDMTNSSFSMEDNEKAKISLTEVYIQYELKAVMRIKLQFFKWFEDFFSKTMNVFLGQSLVPTEKQNFNEKIDQKETDSSSDEKSVDSMILISSEDNLIQNPQQTLICVLCNQKGEFSATGRLIPYKLNMYVHTSCALWTTDVFDIDDGQIVNFYHQQKKLQQQKCVFCGLHGATLSCSKSKTKANTGICQKHYHFPCAYRSGKVKFTKNKETFCETCQNSGRFSSSLAKSHSYSNNLAINNTGGEINQSLNPFNQSSLIGNLGPAHDPIGSNPTNQFFQIWFPSEFLKKKRLYLVQNLEEINQTEYENEIENNQSSKAKVNDNETPSKRSNSKREKEGSQKDQQKGKEIEVDKWRPFYFDLFNRVGNLTVLSLRKDINQLIDIIQQETQQLSGINSMQSYLQKLQQTEASSNPRSKNLIHRSSSSLLNTEGQSSLLDDLQKYLDLHNDFATIRIYWKFYKDKKMKEDLGQRKATDPRKLKRTYFLFLNRTKQIYELEKYDIITLFKFCSEQVRRNPIVISNFKRSNFFHSFLQEKCDWTSNMEDKTILQIQDCLLNKDFFWQRTLDHYKLQSGNFCLQNIEFCIEKLFGQAKYPINVWNKLELTSQDTRQNLSSFKTRIDFFLKSALAILHSISVSKIGYSYPYNILTQNNSLNINQQNTSTGKVTNPSSQSNQQVDFKQILFERVLTIEGIFQRMVKVNTMERYDHDLILNNRIDFKQPQNLISPVELVKQKAFATFKSGFNGPILNRLDQLSVNEVSSKHMTYEQLMIALGKGRKVDISRILRSFKQSNKGTRSRKVKGSEKNEEVESYDRSYLPIAMQFRSSILAPPKTEVRPSKIHRIGLFTLEDLKPLDIVIEYVGEIIRNEVADQREKKYLEKGIGDCYMFRLDDQLIIDATFFGGKARYLNHSCDANCTAKIITVDKQKHIIILAKKHIQAGQELTYNYNFDQEEGQLSCFCGAKNCQGYLA